MREASPWRHLDPTVVLAALALATLGLLAIYSSTFAGLRAQGLPEASIMRRQLLSLGLGLVGWWRPWWSTTVASRPGPGWCWAPWWWPSAWS